MTDNDTEGYDGPVAKTSFHAWDPVEQRYAFYDKGDPVRDEVAALVSDDVVANRPEVHDDPEVTIKRSELEGKISDAAIELAEGREFTAADLDTAVTEAVEKFAADLHTLAGTSPADDVPAPAAPAPTFDPGADGVRAAEVASYLKGLDVSTDEGRAEYERVVAAEKAAHNDGQGRATALA